MNWIAGCSDKPIYRLTPGEALTMTENIPQTMHAVVLTGHGGLDKLEFHRDCRFLCRSLTKC